jgi:hypothetical protein
MFHFKNIILRNIKIEFLPFDVKQLAVPRHFIAGNKLHSIE